MLIVAVAAAAWGAQWRNRSCGDYVWSDARASYCEERDVPLSAAMPLLDIDAGHNGGIRVRG